MEKIVIKKRKTVTVTRYKCDKCGRECLTQREAELCELRHDCKHDDLRYELVDASSDDWWAGYKSVIAICNICETEFDEFKLEDIEDHQQVLKTIYDTLKETSQM